jgi:hypothetical protein
MCVLDNRLQTCSFDPIWCTILSRGHIENQNGNFNIAYKSAEANLQWHIKALHLLKDQKPQHSCLELAKYEGLRRLDYSPSPQSLLIPCNRIEIPSRSVIKH